MGFTESVLLDGAGEELWRGLHADRLQALERAALTPEAGGDALAALCGAQARADGRPWVVQSDLFRLSRELELVSNEGTARGFVLLPPAGVVLERSVEAFNREHVRALEAVEMRLPVVFDHAHDDLRELTRSYDEDGRLFRVEDPRDDLRLSYAADPHLLNWLRGRRLRADRLPYTIVTEISVLRRFKSGELGRLNRVREYRLPDLHTIVTAPGAEEMALAMTLHAAEATRFWVDSSWVQFVDQTEDFGRDYPGLAAALARAAGRPTLVNVLERAPRYYRMRSGLMPDAGTGTLLLYNMQWDEENPRRFGIESDDGQPLVILHGNVAAGSGILCVVLGRALADFAPRVVPIELAELQVVLQPLTDRHQQAAHEHRARLELRGLRAGVARSDASLGKLLQAHRDSWRPYVAVVGDREIGGALGFQPATARERIGEADLFARHGARLERCRPASGAVVRPSPVVP